MTKETLSARITGDTYEELEEYAERRGMSKSEATNRLVAKALKIENGDVELIPVSTDGRGEVANQIEETQKRIQSQSDQIQSQSEQIQEQSEKIDRQKQKQDVLLASLIAGVGWIYGTSALDIDAITTAVFGGIMLLSLSLFVYFNRQQGD